MSGYFKNHKNYEVVNNKNEDINDFFYEQNIENYNKSDYSTIFSNEWDDNISYICHTVVNQAVLNGQNMQPNTSFLSKTVSKEFQNIREDDIVGHRITIYDTITGRFTYNANTGKISSYSSPSLKITYDGAGEAWNMNQKNVSTDARLSGDKYSIIFSASFDVVATVYLDNIPVDADFGNIYDSFETSGD